MSQLVQIIGAGDGADPNFTPNALVGEFTIGARSDRAERLAEIQHQHSILATLS